MGTEELKIKIENLRKHRDHLLKVIGAMYSDRITEEWMERDRKQKIEECS